MRLPSGVILEEVALGAFLVGALLVFVVMGLVFAYHWKRFALPTLLFRKMTKTYFWLSSILAAISVLLYALILLEL